MNDDQTTPEPLHADDLRRKHPSITTPLAPDIERAERLAEIQRLLAAIKRRGAETQAEDCLADEVTYLLDEVTHLTELHERDRGLLSQHSREGRLAIMGSEYEKKHFDDEVARLTALLAERDATVQRVVDLVRDLHDPEPCRFDHRGGCQAHGYLDLKPGETCPQRDAQVLIDPQEPTS